MAFRGTPAAQWKELGQRISYGEGFSGEVNNLTASAPDQTDKPFQFSYDYSKKSFGDWDSHRIVAPLPWFGIESSALDEKPPAEPFVLGALGELVYKSKTALPAGLAPTYSEKMDLSEDFADYHASYTIDNGTLIANRRLVIKKSEVPWRNGRNIRSFARRLLRSAIVLSIWTTVQLNIRREKNRSKLRVPQRQQRIQRRRAQTQRLQPRRQSSRRKTSWPRRLAVTLKPRDICDKGGRPATAPTLPKPRSRFAK